MKRGCYNRSQKHKEDASSRSNDDSQWVSCYKDGSTTSLLVEDLLLALQDDSLNDVNLVSSDGVHVPAKRFVLAARSPVLKKMLYGSFREAKSSTICILGYDSHILADIVQYCSTNTVDKLKQDRDINGNNNNDNNMDESKVRSLVELSKAADFLQLEGLTRMVIGRIHKLITTTHLLPLACAVFDQADAFTELWSLAFSILESRPYMTLVVENSYSCCSSNNNRGSSSSIILGGGGIECMQADRVVSLFKNQSVAAGELFLFRCLKRWYDYQVSGREQQEFALHSQQQHHHQQQNVHQQQPEVTALHVALECCRYIQFANIEPQILLDVEVQSCPFVTPERIFAAVAKQALQASHNKIWSHCRSCRGGGKSASSRSVERILVEGCGVRDAQGLYYRVMGLSYNGGLYTKREVAAGQEWAYTLSCAVKQNKEDGKSYYDCRLFRSKLLTQGAVLTLAQMQRQQTTTTATPIDPVYQPVLQVLNLEQPLEEDENSMDGSDVVFLPNTAMSLMRKFYRARLSDGDHYIQATLSPALTQALQAQQQELEKMQMGAFTIIKILEFGLYYSSSSTNDHSQVGVHVTRLSIVNSNPGQYFGNPQPLPKIMDEVAILPLVRNATTTSGVVVFGGNKNSVEVLYSCSIPVDTREGDAPCPRFGWKAEDSGGSEPCPTVTWIPVVTTTTGVSSTSSTTISTSCSGSATIRRAGPTRTSTEQERASSSSGSSSSQSSVSAASQVSSAVLEEEELNDTSSSSSQELQRRWSRTATGPTESPVIVQADTTSVF